MISLAVKGHIRIDEKKEDVLLGLITKETYTIVKLKGGSGLPKEEQELLNRMFGTGQLTLRDRRHLRPQRAEHGQRVPGHLARPVAHLPEQRQQLAVLVDPHAHRGRVHDLHDRAAQLVSGATTMWCTSPPSWWRT
jgi:hypothetical protein